MLKFLATHAKDIMLILLTSGLTVWTFLRERQEWVARKKLKLAPNPLRCSEMIDRMGKVEGRVKAIEDDVEIIRTDVRQIRDLHIKA